MVGGGRNLPWEIAGRKIRPFAIGVSCATLVMAWTLLWKNSDAGTRLDGTTESLIVGTVALISTALIWLAFIIPSTRILKHGLLFAAGVFAARAAFLFVDVGVSSTPAWICIVIMDGGAYLPEVVSPDSEECRGDDG